MRFRSLAVRSARSAPNRHCHSQAVRSTAVRANACQAITAYPRLRLRALAILSSTARPLATSVLPTSSCLGFPLLPCQSAATDALRSERCRTHPVDHCRAVPFQDSAPLAQLAIRSLPHHARPCPARRFGGLPILPFHAEPCPPLPCLPDTAASCRCSSDRAVHFATACPNRTAPRARAPVRPCRSATAFPHPSIADRCRPSMPVVRCRRPPFRPSLCATAIATIASRRIPILPSPSIPFRADAIHPPLPLRARRLLPSHPSQSSAASSLRATPALA